MADFRDRFDPIRRLDAPDQWDEIRTHGVSQKGPVRRGSIYRSAIAFVLVGGLAAGGVVLLARSRTTSDGPGEGGASPGGVVHGGGGSGGAGSCAFAVTFEGREYTSAPRVVRPVPGTTLGTATSALCDGDSFEIPVARLDELDPKIALVSTDGELILVSSDVSKFPPELTRYLRPPACRPEDEPIDMRGTWLGILGPDGNTEEDLRPPYDIALVVREASSPRYQRADVTVRVPASLGTPLTTEDVRSVLWRGGDIRVVARCRPGTYTPLDGVRAEDGYVAMEVEAYPGD